MQYVRTVKTSSGATAVQIVYSSRRGSRDRALGVGAQWRAGLELLKAPARHDYVRVGREFRKDAGTWPGWILEAQELRVA